MNTNDFLLRAVCYEERACQLLYFRCRKRSKKGLLQLWILRALNNPQSSILNPRYLENEVSRATGLVFTCGNKKICLETAVFRVYREGLRREWIKNTFPQVPRRQRSVHKVDSRDTERCWMRWEISASTQSFTLRENKPHELQGHDNHCFQTINPKDFLPFAKLRFCGGSFAVITSTLQQKLQFWIFQSTGILVFKWRRYSWKFHKWKRFQQFWGMIFLLA